MNDEHHDSDQATTGTTDASLAEDMAFLEEGVVADIPPEFWRALVADLQPGLLELLPQVGGQGLDPITLPPPGSIRWPRESCLGGAPTLAALLPLDSIGEEAPSIRPVPAVTEDTITTLAELLRDGREQDFRDLAAMSGVPSELVESMWRDWSARRGKERGELPVDLTENPCLR